jgi:hypothetical protein
VGSAVWFADHQVLILAIVRTAGQPPLSVRVVVRTEGEPPLRLLGV